MTTEECIVTHPHEESLLAPTELETRKIDCLRRALYGNESYSIYYDNTFFQCGCFLVSKNGHENYTDRYLVLTHEEVATAREFLLNNLEDASYDVLALYLELDKEKSVQNRAAYILGGVMGCNIHAPGLHAQYLRSIINEDAYLDGVWGGSNLPNLSTEDEMIFDSMHELFIYKIAL